MKSSRLAFVITALLTFALSPACATSSYDYKKGEYAVISDGLAPNKRLSLASHGDGDQGDRNFHVWLMAEPSHRRIMTLDDISSSNNLDTGPGAYYAIWSVDSRRVAVSFRSDRHVVQLNIYEIAGDRARLTSGPSLFRDVTSRNIDPQEDVRNRTSGIVWTGPNRFKLSERMLVKTSDAGFLHILGKYGKLSSKEDDGAFFVEFSADADCVIGPGNRYRIVDLKVGEFVQ
jgi:hypothetical protein